jgi:hypothetical protein
MTSSFEGEGKSGRAALDNVAGRGAEDREVVKHGSRICRPSQRSQLRAAPAAHPPPECLEPGGGQHQLSVVNPTGVVRLARRPGPVFAVLGDGPQGTGTSSHDINM